MTGHTHIINLVLSMVILYLYYQELVKAEKTEMVHPIHIEKANPLRIDQWCKAVYCQGKQLHDKKEGRPLNICTKV